jgi:hypothetical protein
MCSCEEALELISKELDQPLSAEEHALLQEHLASCGECGTLALELRELHEEMSDLAAPVPDGFAGSVMAGIRREGSVPGYSGAPQKRDWKRSWRVWGGVAAALILIAAGTGRLFPPGMGSASGSTAAAVPAPAAASESMDAAASNAAAAVDGGGETPESGRSFAATIQAPPETPAATKDSEATGSLSGVGVASSTVITAEDAGYLVLKTAVTGTISISENTTEEKSLTFTAKAESGAIYYLTYTGMSEDGSRYEFVLTAADGSEQNWSAAADGSEAVQVVITEK